MTRSALLAALFLAIACRDETPPCPSYDEAEQVFEDLTSKILDPTFGDPRFEAAAAAFESVAASCPRHETAQMLARTIRDGMAKRRAAPKQPVLPPPPPAPAPRAAAPRPAPRPAPVAPAVEEAPDPAECARAIALNRERCDAACADRRGEVSCLERCDAQVIAALAEAGCADLSPRDLFVKRAVARRRAEARAAPLIGDTAKPSPKAMTYCAFFLPDGNSHMSFCRAAPLGQAQRLCDQELRERGIGGKCACSDDPAFINGRCG